MQCFQRDKAANSPCAICGQPIDYSLRPSSCDEAWEPDHRHSLKAHPELAEVPDNIQPSHRSCNRSKAARASMNQLGTPSRNWLDE